MILESIFGFLLGYDPAVAVIIYAFVVLLLINIFYKVLINQRDAKQLKDKMNEINKQMKEEQKAGNKEKANQLVSEMMGTNGKLMRMTMKPMIVSFIIVIVLLPFLNSSYSDYGARLVNNTGTVSIGAANYTLERTGDGLKIGGIACAPACVESIDNRQFKISMDNDNVHFSRVVVMLPVSLPFIGNTLGWLGWYIITSIPMVVIIRKLLKIYV